jgi:hypothetical protein
MAATTFTSSLRKAVTTPHRSSEIFRARPSHGDLSENLTLIVARLRRIRHAQPELSRRHLASQQ